MYDIRKQYRPPNRVWLAIALLGALMVVLGLALSGVLDQRTRERISGGDEVVAEVVSVSVIPVGKFNPPVRLTVRYVHAGRSVRAHLFDDSSAGRYRTGQRIELYVDPTAPTRVATRDGLASDGWLVLAVPGLMVIGGFVLLANLVGVWRWWRRYRRLTSQGVPAVAADVIVGGSHLLTPWGRQAKAVAAEITDAGRSVTSSVNLWVVFLATGEDIRPGFVGVRVAWFDRRQRRLLVEAALAGDEDRRELRNVMIDLLERAVGEAEKVGRNRGIASGLDTLRAVGRDVAARSEPS